MKIASKLIAAYSAAVVVNALASARPGDIKPAAAPAPEMDGGVCEVPAPKPEPYVAPCPDGMVLVDGDYCPKLEEKCKTYMEPKSYDLCLEFASTMCKTPEDQLKPMRFCVDMTEYTKDPVFESPAALMTPVTGPKFQAQRHLPEMMISYNDLKNICAEQGKRVCTDEEFTQACRGPDNKPYPYGFKRDNNLCQTDGPLVDWDPDKLSRHDTEEARRVDRRMPVNAFPNCVSDYGALNMSGGVDENTRRTSMYGPYENALKSGHDLGHVRNRCTPATFHHDEMFAMHTIGGRCCAEAGPSGQDQKARASLPKALKACSI